MKTNRKSITSPSYVACAGLVRVSVWEFTAQGFLTHKILLSNLYKSNRIWQRGRTFRGNQLQAVALAVADANDWIKGRQAALREE